jgi:hypothetical protein
MLTPEIHQTEFAHAILGHPHYAASRALQLTARPGANPQARLGIYRNNTYASLTAALLATFPVTARLVDERFLRYAASRFIDRGLPNEPRLSQFGGEFPRFLAGMEQLQAMPFVAETARLEWLIAQALDEPALIGQPLTALSWLDEPDEAALSLQPSLRLFASRWPIFELWSAHQDADEPDLPVVRRGPLQRVVLWRTHAAVRLAALDTGEMRFLRVLASGSPLARAALRARNVDPMFDLAGALARLFGCGLVTAIARHSH